MVRFDLTHDDRQKAQLSSPPHSDLHLQQKPVVHGDKEKPELTRQYNEGYKTDLAEPHAGPGGCDDVNEIKLWTPLLTTSSPGVGNASSGGTPASVVASPTPLATPKRRPAA